MELNEKQATKAKYRFSTPSRMHDQSHTNCSESVYYIMTKQSFLNLAY